MIKTFKDIYFIIEVVKRSPVHYLALLIRGEREAKEVNFTFDIQKSDKMAYKTYTFITKDLCIKKTLATWPTLNEHDHYVKNPRELIKTIKKRYYVHRITPEELVNTTGYWGRGSTNLTKYNYVILGVKDDNSRSN